MTASLQVMTSSESPHWCTPPEVLAPVRRFAPIRFDPFSNVDSLVQAAESIMPPDDSLLLDWPTDGLNWANPPYGRALARCAKKIAEQARRGAEIVTLVPARTDTQWWRCLAPLCWCAWEGRITFLEDEQAWRVRMAAKRRLSAEDAANLRPRRLIAGLVAADPAPFAAALCYHGPRPQVFATHFAPYGEIYFAAGQRVHRALGRPRAPLPPAPRVLEGLLQGRSIREIAAELALPKNRIEQQVRLLRPELETVRKVALSRTTGMAPSSDLEAVRKVASFRTDEGLPSSDLEAVRKVALFRTDGPPS